MNFSDGTKVGILGGGQLARMLAEAAHSLGLRPIVYSAEADCPAAHVCGEIRVGKVEDARPLRDFLAETARVTFENEFVDCTRLRDPFKSDATLGSAQQKFFPPLSAIELLQDKSSQKKLLTRLGIPTAPFIELVPSQESLSEINRAFQVLGQGIVLKWSRLGYDGKGVHVLHRGAGPSNKASQANKASQDPTLHEALEFVERARVAGIPVLAEALVSFRRELAIIGCAPDSSSKAPPVFYPLVISEQEGGVCKRVYGPATALGVDPALEQTAIQIAGKIARETGLCGAFGIEFFETSSGDLLVNEIAPRVHNTGHYTQNVYPSSQFENHWRAILGLPLSDPSQSTPGKAPFFAMLNLLGPVLPARPSLGTRLPVPGPRAHLHWYGKREIRVGRKLGHLNATAGSPAELQAALSELSDCERAWVAGLAATRAGSG